MMNRSVMGRQMFQDGGMAMPDPMAETMPMDPAMAGNPDNPNNLDENMVNEAMMAAAQDFGNIDDADDYEGMINSIRGDKAPMAERVNELAELVGLEDAQQTPESVVALIQPVMLLNSMDQGIGSIAEGVMDTEMSGDMTGGIMSTVNMEPPMEPAMAQPMPMDPGMDPGMGMPMGMEAGNEPPVNFRLGGPVARMQAGGDPVEESRLSQLFAEQQGVLNDNFGRAPVDPMDLEREREMNQAQMLFDVAGTALAFATPGSTQMSPAQRLAEAATETQLFDKIGARAQNQMDSEKAGKEARRTEKRDLDLLAFKGAQDQLDRELSITPTKLYDFKVVDGQLVKINNKTGGTSLAFSGPEKLKFMTVGDNIVTASARTGEVKVAFTDDSPDRRILSKGQQLLDARTGSVIYTAPENAQLEKVGGFLVDVTNRTPDGNATVIFEAPEYKVEELNGQLVQYKIGDPESAVAIFGEKGIDIDPVYMVQTNSATGAKNTFDATTPAGKAIIANANQANADAGTTVITLGKLGVDKTPSATAFNLGNKIVLSYDGGRSYINTQGVNVPMPTEGAVPVSDTIASEIQKKQRIYARAGEALTKLNDDISTAMGVPDDLRIILRNADEAAMNGTGFMAKLATLADKTIGQFPGVTAFQETEADKQYLRAITQMTKSALVLNRRFPVAELNKVELLYPNVDDFFVSRVSETNKLREIKRVALAQKKQNLTKLSEGGLSDEIIKDVQSNNHQIDRLLAYLGPVGIASADQGGDADQKEQAMANLRAKVNKG